MPVDEGGTPTPDAVAYRIGDQTEVLVGQPYELRGSAVFECADTEDGVAFYTGVIWNLISEHYGVVPFWYRVDYDMIPIVQDGGRNKWFIHSFACQFTPVKSESVVAALLVLLTSWQFWLGLGAIIALTIIALSFTFFILKPAGEFAGGLGAVLIVLVLAVLALVYFMGVPKRKGKT